MNEVTPAAYHEWTQLVQKMLWLKWLKVTLTESTNCVHSWYGVAVTSFIQGTRLVWPRSFMVQGRCDYVHSWYGVDAIWYVAGVILYSVHCTVVFIWRIYACFCAHKSTKMQFYKFTLRSQHKETLTSQLRSYYSAFNDFLLILWWRPFNML